ncbi:hypothetical protein [Rickettsia endosymbiont of Halotydeus destructor]|uniref:hypothetical protein n=1 Tax=Rickettsia endosymbiont of Halotydeus destructor TaxID=2996754 RepID=UPI003BB16D49
MNKQSNVSIPPLDLTHFINSKNEEPLSSSSSEDEELFKKPASKTLNDEQNIFILEYFCKLINEDEKDLIELLFKTHPYILHVAAECGAKESVKKILELKPELINVVIYNGLTVLHSAVLGVADLEIFKILLEANPALINAEDGWSNTPWHYGQIHGFGKNILTDNLLEAEDIQTMLQGYVKDFINQSST